MKAVKLTKLTTISSCDTEAPTSPVVRAICSLAYCSARSAMGRDASLVESRPWRRTNAAMGRLEGEIILGVLSEERLLLTSSRSDVCQLIEKTSTARPPTLIDLIVGAKEDISDEAITIVRRGSRHEPNGGRGATGTENDELKQRSSSLWPREHQTRNVTAMIEW